MTQQQTPHIFSRRCVPVSLLMMSCCSSVLAEVSLSFYGGLVNIADSDVKLQQPGDTRLTFHDVAWDDKSFVGPVYWGLRLSYWTHSHPDWGLALDLTHAKMHSNLNSTVTVTGIRQGTAISSQQPLGDTFNELDMSHGYNLLTLNAIHRWDLTEQRDRAWLTHLQPYVGFGAGIALPHVEVAAGGTVTDEYQIAGPAVNGMAGVHYDLGQGYSLMAEYRLSYADMDTDLSGGGSLQTTVWGSHFNFGVAYAFQ